MKKVVPNGSTLPMRTTPMFRARCILSSIARLDARETDEVAAYLARAIYITENLEDAASVGALVNAKAFLEFSNKADHDTIPDARQAKRAGRPAKGGAA